MIFRSRAPLRIGLAGGGTDVSPYSELYGGAVINAAISLFAYAEIDYINEKKIILYSADRNQQVEAPINEMLPVNGTLDLLKGMYNRILKDYGPFNTGIRLSTSVDAPLGSGLGTSSTLMVAIAGAFRQMLKLPMDNEQLAHFAYEVERIDLGFSGGKQDQYAAVFGGLNYMEFLQGDKTIVTPLAVDPENLAKLEQNLVLYYTSLNRESSVIIREQQQNVREQNETSIGAMHALKIQSKMMLDAITAGKINDVGKILDFGFQHKKKMARNISNPLLDSIYRSAIEAGATGGKISGAGGGGFMIFYCPGGTRNAVCEALHNFGGYIQPFTFSIPGLTAWEE
jgi:D-glycero-alpha-D-manno-heptose-7-phosphate kinase